MLGLEGVQLKVHMNFNLINIWPGMQVGTPHSNCLITVERCDRHSHAAQHLYVHVHTLLLHSLNTKEGWVTYMYQATNSLKMTTHRLYFFQIGYSMQNEMIQKYHSNRKDRQGHLLRHHTGRI